MKTQHTALLSVLISLSAASMAVISAHAEDIPVRGPMSFSSYDSDGNGVITQEEFNAAHVQRMQTNSAAGMPMKGMANAPMFSDFDSNGDGTLNADELRAGQLAQQQKNQSQMQQQKQQNKQMQQQNKQMMQQQNKQMQQNKQQIQQKQSQQNQQ